jgi:hypothetical protein
VGGNFIIDTKEFDAYYRNSGLQLSFGFDWSEAKEIAAALDHGVCQVRPGIVPWPGSGSCFRTEENVLRQITQINRVL